MEALGIVDGAVPSPTRAQGGRVPSFITPSGVLKRKTRGSSTWGTDT